MRIDQFWDLIEESRGHSTDGDKQIEFLRTWLGSASDEDVLGFDEILHNELLSKSHTYALAFAFGILSPSRACTLESFKYLRSWLILQGRQVFGNIVENPDELAQFEQISECKHLYLLARQEYKRRNGKSMSEPREPIMPDQPESQAEYEQFLGKARQRYPALCHKVYDDFECHPDDITLLRDLAAQGDQLAVDRPVAHFFICPDHTLANSLADELSKLGHKIESATSEGDSLVLHSMEIGNPLAVTQRTEHLLDLACRFKCQYDGWGTNAQPAELNKEMPGA